MPNLAWSTEALIFRDRQGYDIGIAAYTGAPARGYVVDRIQPDAAVC